MKRMILRASVVPGLALLLGGLLFVSPGPSMEEEVCSPPTACDTDHRWQEEARSDRVDAEFCGGFNSELSRKLYNQARRKAMDLVLGIAVDDCKYIEPHPGLECTSIKVVNWRISPYGACLKDDSKYYVPVLATLTYQCVCEARRMVGEVTPITNSGGKITGVRVEVRNRSDDHIASVTPAIAENMDVEIPDGSGNSFGPGETYTPSAPTYSLTIKATRKDMSVGGRLLINVCDTNGCCKLVDPVLMTLSAEVPERFTLEQNSPNPFGATTTIRFSVVAAAPVTLEVFDLSGRRIAVLVNEVLAAGTYAYEWGGATDGGQAVPSGSYVYRLSTGERTESRTMVLVK